MYRFCLLKRVQSHDRQVLTRGDFAVVPMLGLGLTTTTHLELLICGREHVEPELLDLVFDARVRSVENHSEMVISPSLRVWEPLTTVPTGRLSLLL